MPAELREIRIYPVKALDPIVVPAVRVVTNGALEHDREWAIADAQGRFLNGKRTREIHRLRGFDADFLASGAAEAGQSLSRILGEPVTLVRNSEGGFPDDTDSPGPTLVSRASIETVAGWFGWDAESTRRRFRANLEIDGVPAFWEDRLYGGALRIGDVLLEAVNPCQRCVVPSRDPANGEEHARFQREFAELRKAHLPSWADPARFNHYYRFAVNTRIPQSEWGKWIKAFAPCTLPPFPPNNA